MGISGGMYGYGGVREVPSGGAELGQSLASLGQGLQRIIDPNFELQKQLQSSMALNPDLGQAIADRAYETGDPNFLDKMVGGKVANTIRQIQPSPVAQKVLEIKHQLGPAGIQDAGKFHEMMQALPPELAQAVGKHMGMDIYGSQEAQANLQKTQQETQLGAAQLPGQLEKAKQISDYWADPMTPGDVVKMGNAMAQGKGEIPPKALIAMTADPQGVGQMVKEELAAAAARRRGDMTQAQFDLRREGQTQTMSRGYSAQLKPDVDRAGTYNRIDEQLDALNQKDAQGNPTAAAKVAQSQVPAALGGLDVIRPQMRAMMYKYMGKYDSSFEGQFEKWASVGFTGVPPQSMIDGLKSYADHIATTERERYTANYEAKAKVLDSMTPGGRRYLTESPDIVYGKMGLGKYQGAYESSHSATDGGAGASSTGAADSEEAKKRARVKALVDALPKQQ